MSTATKFAGAGAAVLGLGYGSYFMSQSSIVGKFEKAEQDAAKLIEGEKKKIKTITTTISESETKTAALGKQLEDATKAVKAFEPEVEAARKKLQELEKGLKAKQDTASKISKEMESIASKIISLRQDAERSTEAATLGERSLKIARQQAAEARKLYNPLNHPHLKAMMGGK